MRRTIIITLLVSLMITSIAYGDSYNLETPQFISINTVEYPENSGTYFVLRWKNSEETNKLIEDEEVKSKFFYEISFATREDNIIKEGKLTIPATDTKLNANGLIEVNLDPVKVGITNLDIDIIRNSYSFRVRYGIRNTDILGDYNTYGFHTSTVTIGLQHPYLNCSGWAIPELDKALEYELITNKISSNMKEDISREEFSELIIKFYEKKTEEILTYSNYPFTDTINTEVLKAAELGIIKGVGGDKFEPNAHITRQEIAVILKRTLDIIYPELKYSDSEVLKTSEANVANWAINEINFLKENGILVGDESGKINPIETTSREEAVILTLRTYEKFN